MRASYIRGGSALAAIPEAPRTPTAIVLCGDGLPSMLERIVSNEGFEVVATVDRWSDAVQQVADLAIDVAVLDLGQTGTVGVRIVPALRALAPACQVIVVSPLEAIDLVLLELGAVVVPATDLRPLMVALRHVLRSRIGS